MTRLIVLLVLTAAAVAIALLIQRRRPDPPSAPSYRAPTQLDRSDFDGIDTPILLVVFASTTCDSYRRSTGQTRWSSESWSRMTQSVIGDIGLTVFPRR